jgi:dTDP-glucose pyrophosphorylase
MKNLEANFLSADSDIKLAIATIDRSPAKIALVVDQNRTLLGTITDGDIRRAILNGAQLSDAASKVMNTSPRVGRVGEDRAPLIDLMRRNVCRHVPIINEIGQVVALETLQELVDYGNQENWVVLMAGGLGKRLRPLTELVPKPMLSVGERPILEIIIKRLRSQGFHRFFVSLNYLGDMIRDHFGDGSQWGVQIEYLTEDKPLGTAGSLSLLPTRSDKPLVVMNGDILTKIDFRQLLQFHEEHKAQATTCVRDYFVDVPYGVIDNDGHRIRGIHEKPRHRFLVNAGIYTLQPDVLELIPRGDYFDMPMLIDALIARGQHACVFPIREYWIDVGRLEEYDRAKTEFDSEFRPDGEDPQQ